MIHRKKHKSCRHENPDLFDDLPEDLVVLILGKLSRSSSSPSDFVSVLLTCKRLNRIGLHPQVLSVAGQKTLAVKAKNWSGNAHRFLKRCVNSGNLEASYMLGMIRFYCLKQRNSGASLIAKAAIKSHASATYSLAVIKFNGSGGTKENKDLRAAVALCARAANLGHLNALREIGHCLQDGYGVSHNIVQGRKLLAKVNACELASVLDAVTLSLSLPSNNRSNNKLPSHDQQCCSMKSHYPNHHLKQLPFPTTGLGRRPGFGWGFSIPSGSRYNILEIHSINRFMLEWFNSGIEELNEGLSLCSHFECGRPETRQHEFRRCSVCGVVKYCSRACQALDWKYRHKVECEPLEGWMVEVDDAAIG